MRTQAAMMVILGALTIRTGTAETHSCLVLELLSQVGWVVPGLDGSSTKIADVRVKMAGVPEDVAVDVLTPGNADAAVTLVKCINDQAGRLEVRNQPIHVNELLRFKKAGRVFAYKINAGLTGGNGVALGAAEVLLFYDPDGSGRFTIQRDVAGAKFPVIVPAWVNNMTKAPQ
jgi:hypothetical protein